MYMCVSQKAKSIAVGNRGMCQVNTKNRVVPGWCFEIKM
jgi:hypothetical protein